MNCPNCKVGTIKDGKYICKSDGYHIADSNGDVLFILKQDNIPSDDSEIETSSGQLKTFSICSSSGFSK